MPILVARRVGRRWSRLQEHEIVTPARQRFGARQIGEFRISTRARAHLAPAAERMIAAIRARRAELDPVLDAAP